MENPIQIDDSGVASVGTRQVSESQGWSNPGA